MDGGETGFQPWRRATFREYCMRACSSNAPSLVRKYQPQPVVVAELVKSMRPREVPIATWERAGSGRETYSGGDWGSKLI